MDLTIQYADVIVEGLTVKVAHRGTPTDLAIIDVVFKHRQFYPNADRADHLVHDYERIVQSGNTPLIIDAGANIGTSTIWFAETFPKAHIVAVEPDDENFVLLAMNSEGRWIDLRKGAVGANNGVGSLVDPGRGPLGFMMSDYAGGRPTLRWGVDKIIEEKLAIGMEPFIFKCDIEGGERETFLEGEKWINRFYLVIIEPHDWMLPGQGTFANFLRSVGSFHRDFIFFGENVFSYRNP